MGRAFVIGIGLTAFGRHPARSVEDLAAEAIIAACEDAGVEWRRVEQFYAAHVNQGVAAGQRVIREVGPSGIPVLNIENCSAAASSAVREASLAVRSGEMDLVVVCGFEKMQHGVLLNVHPEHSPEVATGTTVLPMRFALMAQKHMDRFDTTMEQIAGVCVKNRSHARYNSKAQFRAELSLEDVLESRMICDPITLFQCSPTTDGAAAAVICSGSFAARHGSSRAVELRASGLVSDIDEQAHNVFDLEMVRSNASGVYERAGIGPGDLDVVEVHDCFWDLYRIVDSVTLPASDPFHGSRESAEPNAPRRAAAPVPDAGCCGPRSGPRDPRGRRPRTRMPGRAESGHRHARRPHRSGWCAGDRPR